MLHSGVKIAFQTRSGGYLRPALMRFESTRVTRVHPNARRELARLAAVRQNVLQSSTEAAPPTRRRSARLYHPSAAVRAQDRLNAPFIAWSKRGPER